jgi:hypothetical protein
MTGAADIVATAVIVLIGATAVIGFCLWVADKVIKAIDFLTRNE